MGARPTTFSVAIACGTAGAYVDVTDYLESEEDFTYTWGRQSSFEDVAPGEFSFALDNRDGRFTPNNLSSPLVLPIQQGMGISWQVNSRVVSGTIQGADPSFRDDDAAHAMVVITADDMLGNAGRHTIGNLTTAMVLSARPYLYYPLNDPETSLVAVDQSGNNAPPLVGTFSSPYAFGADGVPAVGETQLQISNGAAGNQVLAAGNTAQTAASPALVPVTYPAGSLGVLGVWLTPASIATSSLSVAVRMVDGVGGVRTFLVGLAAGQFTVTPTAGFTVSAPAANSVGPSYYVAGGTTYTGSPGSYTVTTTLYVNGIAVATQSGATASITAYTPVAATLTSASVSDVSEFSHFSFSPTLLHEEWAATTTETNRLTAIASTTPEITLGTLPAGLSVEPIGIQDANSATLDAMNDVMRTEQGYIDTVTAGTLTAPVQSIRVRERSRPTAVTTTWDIELDLQGAPQFAYDVTDMVAEVDVSGTPDASGNDTSATVTDLTLKARVGSANDSLDILYNTPSDLYTAGTDRLNRGKNTRLKATSAIVDLLSGNTNRWADVLTMKPGDRHQLTNTPVAQLGFPTWDGWVLGASETYHTNEAQVEIFYDPCTPAEALYELSSGTGDGDRFEAGGTITLTSSVTTTGTTLALTTASGATPFGTANLPYNILIDKEELTVTATTGTSATVTRSVNGVVATHATGASVDMFVDAVYAY